MSDLTRRVPLSDIHIPRADRQRRVVSTENIKDSIAKRGVLQPIIIRRSAEGEPGPFVLVAGERRYTAASELGHTDIPIRLAEDLSPIEASIIELEENIKRENLDWRDEAIATAKLHATYCQMQGPLWGPPNTAEAIGLSREWILKTLRVARDINSPTIREAGGIKPAYNILFRQDDRKANDAINDIVDAGASIFDEPPKPGASAPPPRPQGIQPPEASVLCEDFLTWAPTYSGPRFNFIHCDFPYGLDVFDGAQSGRGSGHDTYGDSEGAYWALLQCLCTNLDRVMLPSGHMMFWFSMEYYTETIERFATWAPSLQVQTFPLLWIKSDNMGILPDPKRGPRRIYETALIASREDRFIIKPVSNAYSAPSDKTWHPSTKPEPMLRQFFQMFVDENTMMLDPTCGGGSALRAAESLGAKRVLGLEANPQFHANAISALRNFRILRAAAR